MRMLDTFWHKWLRRPYNLSVFLDKGAGEALVLLHGVGGNGALWSPLLQLVDDKKHRVVVLDLLGFGDSPKPKWGRYDTAQHARAVVATLDKLKTRSPVTLVCHSMGCLVGLRVAADWPSRVNRLILYEPPLFAATDEHRGHAKRRAMYFAFYEYIFTHPELFLAQHRLIYRLVQRFSGFLLSEETWIPFERSIKHTIIGQTAYDDLQKITMPTDIIYGRRDLIVTRVGIKQMLKSRPNIKIHTTNGRHGLTRRAARHLARLLG